MLKKRFTAILMAALMLISCVNTVTATQSGYAYGDVDKSGTITSNDAATVLAYVLEPTSNPDFDTELANVSSDKDAITGEEIISLTFPFILSRTIIMFAFNATVMQDTPITPEIIQLFTIALTSVSVTSPA